MANANTPTGLNPVRYLSGAPYNGAVTLYSVAAGYGTAIYVGDPVVDIGTSQTSAIDGGVTKDVQLAATTDVITGVVVAVVPDDRSSLTYRAASTRRLLMVADDPNLVFEVQEGTGGTPLTANDDGLNVSFAAGTGSTFTGRSGLTIDNATEATTNTLALKLITPVTRADNAIGDSCKWLVRINRHRYVDQIAGV
jgi:hypothetical protein